MRLPRKVLCCLLAAACSAAFFVTPAYADIAPVEIYNKEVEVKAAALEEKYNIRISYPFTNSGYSSIGTATLSTLDNALEYVTPQIVKQVSNYYQQRNGRRLHFSYVHKDLSGGDIVLATFDNRNSVIEVYIPFPDASAVVTGSSPIAIVHEFGHALQQMYTNQYGYTVMMQDWITINGGYHYAADNLNSNPDKYTFISGYAATDFEEDFAETFAYAMVCNRPGLGIASRLYRNGKVTPLGRKVAYIERIIPILFSSYQQSLNNLKKVYSTAAVTTYRDARLSGSYLEFMGYNAPTRVLEAMLEAMSLEPVSTEWIRDVGGWCVKDRQGNEYILFPGGTWGSLSRKSARAA